MKKVFKAVLAVYSVMLLSVYLKLLPNPSDFFITRDTFNFPQNSHAKVQKPTYQRRKQQIKN